MRVNNWKTKAVVHFFGGMIMFVLFGALFVFLFDQPTASIDTELGVYEAAFMQIDESNGSSRSAASEFFAYTALGAIVLLLWYKAVHNLSKSDDGCTFLLQQLGGPLAMQDLLAKAAEEYDFQFRVAKRKENKLVQSRNLSADETYEMTREFIDAEEKYYRLISIAKSFGFPTESWYANYLLSKEPLSEEERI